MVYKISILDKMEKTPFPYLDLLAQEEFSIKHIFPKEMNDISYLKKEKQDLLIIEPMGFFNVGKGNPFARGTLFYLNVKKQGTLHEQTKVMIYTHISKESFTDKNYYDWGTVDKVLRKPMGRAELLEEVLALLKPEQITQ